MEATGAGAAEAVELTLLAREAGALVVLEVPDLTPVVDLLEVVEVVAATVGAPTTFFTATPLATGFATPDLLGPEVADGCNAGFIARKGMCKPTSLKSV